VVALVAIAFASTGCSSGDSSSPALPHSSGAGVSPTMRAVSQNLLHGIDCPAASDRCDLPARVALFVRQLDEAGCPDLVGLQEVNDRTVSLLDADAAKVCGGRYDLLWDGDPGLDREAVLTTRPVLGWRRTHLPGPLRTALWVRVATEVGVVDFVTTHLASSSDDRPCDATTCPPPCHPDDSLNTCQARELVVFADTLAAPDAVVIVGGDLNATVGEPAVAAIQSGGFTDTHFAAGLPECDPATGSECTAGRIDDSLTDLTNPSSRQSERIDYLFVGGPRRCSVVAPTGLFNAQPATTGPGELAFPADHTGVETRLACVTTEAQRQAAASATVTTAATTAPAPPTTSTAAPGEADSATVAAITAAFRAVFDGDVTDVDTKLSALEDAGALRPYFLATYAATKATAARVRVRIDDIRLVDPTHADVTYTLLLDGSAVLDHLPGHAVQIDGRWLVSRRTYCDVSTQGATTIPPPCQ
jgi:endonuclease/exonuclease/phosphatase family metal-dependent hydrolase